MISEDSLYSDYTTLGRDWYDYAKEIKLIIIETQRFKKSPRLLNGHKLSMVWGATMSVCNSLFLSHHRQNVNFVQIAHVLDLA